MAWTAPRTYVTGEVLTASIFNTDHRDNLLALSTHGHSGSGGDGGTTLGNLVQEKFTDAAAPAAPGAGLTSLYTVSGVPHMRAGAAGADTEISIAGHLHTIVVGATGQSGGNFTTANSNTGTDNWHGIVDNTVIKSVTVTITESLNRVFIFGGMSSGGNNGASFDYEIDDVVQQSGMTLRHTTSGHGGQDPTISGDVIEVQDMATGSTKFELQANAGTTIRAAMLHVREAVL